VSNPRLTFDLDFVSLLRSFVGSDNQRGIIAAGFPVTGDDLLVDVNDGLDDAS
jgi:hypothetical protein